MAETVHPPSLRPPGLSALVSPVTEFLLTEMDSSQHSSQTHSTQAPSNESGLIRGPGGGVIRKTTHLI